MSLIEKALKRAEREKKYTNNEKDLLPQALLSSPVKKRFFRFSFVFFVIFLLPFIILILFFCYESWVHPIEPSRPISLKSIFVNQPPSLSLPQVQETKPMKPLTEQKVLTKPSPLPEKKEEGAKEVSPETKMKKSASHPIPQPLLTPLPNLSPVHFEKGKELLAQGNLSQAKEEFQSSLALNSINPYAHNNLGIIFQKEGDLLKAEEEFVKALEQDPFSEKILNNLGLNSYLLMKWDKALSSYQAALKIDPRNTETYINLALLYKKFNDLKAAKEALNKALSLNPSQPEVLYNIAVLLEDLGEKGKAKEYYQRFISLSGPAHQGLAEKVKNHLNDLQ